jgi:DNA-3-methyladenine glycosylase I
MDGIITDEDGVNRCFWAGPDPLYRRYHDEEWGRPVADDTRLFEKLCLEGFQSGLAWITILRKRENFRAAFAGFDIPTVAAFTDADVDRLVGDAGIVRHRGKIVSTINNARRALDLQAEAGSLAAFIWRFEPDPASRPAVFTMKDIEPKTAESTALSKELRKRGWSFVGPTTVYAFMQAMGLVNDHLTGCDVRDAVEKDRAAFIRPK